MARNNAEYLFNEFYYIYKKVTTQKRNPQFESKKLWLQKLKLSDEYYNTSEEEQSDKRPDERQSEKPTEEENELGGGIGK